MNSLKLQPISITNLSTPSQLLSQQIPLRLCDHELANVVQNIGNTKYKPIEHIRAIDEFTEKLKQAILKCESIHKNMYRVVNQCIDLECIDLVNTHCEHSDDSCRSSLLENICCIL